MVYWYAMCSVIRAAEFSLSLYWTILGSARHACIQSVIRSSVSQKQRSELHWKNYNGSNTSHDNSYTRLIVWILLKCNQWNTKYWQFWFIPSFQPFMYDFHGISEKKYIYIREMYVKSHWLCVDEQYLELLKNVFLKQVSQTK